jgi:hypothetical protein
LPSILGSRERWTGNDLAQMLDYAKRLRELNVDFLHVVAGYGFLIHGIRQVHFRSMKSRCFQFHDTSA